MRKNTLYEVLEVSENASEEVIEKAYKVLAKKYHPDLQSEANKKSAENKMKKINEAYDVLGNEEKRKEYDKTLEQQRREEKLKQEMELERQRLEKEEYNQQNQVGSDINNTNETELQRQLREYEKDLKRKEMQQRQKMQENLNREYENAYYNYLRSLGYKVKHRITKENVRDFLIVIVIMIGIIAALWFIPPTHNWMVNFYESNPVLKAIIDLIIGIIRGIFSGIWEFITGLFN